MSCWLLRTLHGQRLLLKTLRPLLVRLRRHLLGPWVVLRLGYLLVRLLVSLKMLLGIRLGVSLLRHILGRIPLRVRLVAHLRGVWHGRCLLHGACVQICRAYALRYVLHCVAQRCLGVLHGKTSRLLHVCHGLLHLLRRGQLRKRAG